MGFVWDHIWLSVYMCGFLCAGYRVSVCWQWTRSVQPHCLQLLHFHCFPWKVCTSDAVCVCVSAVTELYDLCGVSLHCVSWLVMIYVMPVYMFTCVFKCVVEMGFCALSQYQLSRERHCISLILTFEKTSTLVLFPINSLHCKLAPTVF